MATQTFTTTYEHSEFQELIAECLSEIIRRELAKALPDSQKQKEVLTRQETAELLNISLPTLHNYTLSGLIKAHRIGHMVRYLLVDVHEALKAINSERSYCGH